jgi:CheY-like chemotaxis protein
MLEEQLRDALNRLYDPVFLRKSPLVALLGLEAEENAAEALRITLDAAIRALKPPPNTPSTTRSHRYYQVLYSRYVQQFTQSDVARKLAVSIRQLRREQDAAIHALAEYLRERYRLDSPAPAEEELAAGEEANHVERELAWAESSLGDSSTTVVPVLENAVGLVGELARQRHVRLELEVRGDLPMVAVARTVLTQIVLDLLTACIRAVPCGAVSVVAEAEEQDVMVGVTAEPAAGTGSVAIDEGALAIPRRLAELFQGQLDVVAGPVGVSARIRVPAVAQIPILAIEDNADTVQLWQRFVQDSPFGLVGVTEPREAVAVAASLQPRVIVLDVMMPGIDGWELLGQLLHHPATGGIPVVVCSVHPQAELALSLGASAFVRKPVTRQVFRAVLEHHSAAVARA